MKKYRILKPIVLGFTAPQDQYDALFTPENNVALESDGHTIWVIKDDKREESITIAAAIEIWLNQGLIVEI